MKKVKPKLAIIAGANCGGCDVALVNAVESFEKILSAFDIVYWTTALDSKLEDLFSQEIDVAIVLGSARTEHHRKLFQYAKEKAKLVVAFGTCACYGGIQGLANLFFPRELLKIARSTASTEEAVGLEIEQIPKLLPFNEPLSAVLEADIFVPGCPPPVESVDKLANLLFEFLESGEKPKKVFVADSKSLCEECPRKPESLEAIVIPEIKRVSHDEIDPEKCFLEQGILCLGPVTRAGCGHLCIKANVPCTGCFGPVPAVDDAGIKFLSVVASALFAGQEREIGEEKLKEEIEKIVDPLGTFYRFTFASSKLIELLKRRRGEA